MFTRLPLRKAVRHPRRVLGHLGARAASWHAALVREDAAPEVQAEDSRNRADAEALMLGGLVSGLSLGLAAGVWLGGLRYTTPAGAALGLLLAWLLVRRAAAYRDVRRRSRSQ